MIWILNIDFFSLVRQLRNRENTGFADADAYLCIRIICPCDTFSLGGKLCRTCAQDYHADDFNNIIRCQ